MIRAVFFDFYGVWVPDIISEYLKEAEQYGPQVSDELVSLVSRYYHGEEDIQAVAGAFKYRLNRPDIELGQFLLNANTVSPAIVTFMRELHEHFLKVGVLANLGRQEFDLLTRFNDENQLLEVIAGPLPFQSGAPLLSQEIFAQALHTIGEPPDSTLVVTGNDIYQRFAESIGMQTLRFQGFPKLKEELETRLANELPN